VFEAAKPLLKQLLTCIAAIVAAHALAFFLMRALPSAATVALGLQSTNVEVVAAFESSAPVRSYRQTVVDFAHLQLGRTLDGTSVSSELLAALKLSLPVLALSMLLALLTAAIFALSPRARAVVPSMQFFVFLPPFLFAFLAGSSQLFGNVIAPIWLTIAASAALACCLFAVQAHAAMAQELALPHAEVMRMFCATERDLRLKLLPGVLVKLAPSLETGVSLTLASLLFAEPILGQAGIGTLAARAVRRSDVDLLLGAVLLFATCIAIARLVGWGLRRHYRLPT